MSKIFYDHLIILEEVDILVKEIAQSKDEQEELWKIIDEILHHRMLGIILDHLPQEHHIEFLEKFHKFPHDERHMDWLNRRTHRDIEDVIKEEARELEREILAEISS